MLYNRDFQPVRLIMSLGDFFFAHIELEVDIASLGVDGRHL